MTLARMSDAAARLPRFRFQPTEWLSDCERMFSRCQTEVELISVARQIVSGTLAPRQLAIALSNLESGRLSLMSCLRGADTLGASETGEPFEQGSPLRRLLDGPLLGPEGRGWLSGAASGVDSSWPFGEPILRPLWLSLRAHGEVVGCMVIDLAPGESFVPGDMTSLMVLVGMLALHVQVLRLRNERDSRAQAVVQDSGAIQVHGDLDVDTLRREFLATVSHELRTPLTGIIGFAETLTHFWDVLTNDRRRDAIDKMLASAQRLDRLVRDLLLATRVEDPNFSLRVGSVNARIVLHQAANEIEAKYPGQAVAVIVPELDVIVRADRERLAQVLVNLLDNAVKYSADGSSITVGLDTVEDRGRFWVRDEGPGFDGAQMEQLFERFGKLGHTPRAGLGGAGLGLYISRHLVRAMGGDLSVQSSVGQGSTFAFSLPAATVDKSQ